MEESEKKESWAIGFIYIFNTIIGTTFFGYPWVFSNAGYAYGTIIQTIATILSFILSYLVIQTWLRVTTISNLTENGHTVQIVPLKDIFSNSQKSYIEKNNIKSESDDESKPLIFNTNNNYYQMMKVTMGEFYANLFLFIFTLNRIPLLASLASIFSSSMISNVHCLDMTHATFTIIQSFLANAN